jgi:hypothetical protein
LVFGHSYGNINPTVKIPRLRLLQFVVPHKRKVESIALYTTDTLMIEVVFKRVKQLSHPPSIKQLQWKPLNVITLGLMAADNINQMIMITGCFSIVM